MDLSPVVCCSLLLLFLLWKQVNFWLHIPHALIDFNQGWVMGNSAPCWSFLNVLKVLLHHIWVISSRLLSLCTLNVLVVKVQKFFLFHLGIIIRESVLFYIEEPKYGINFPHMYDLIMIQWICTCLKMLLSNVLYYVLVYHIFIIMYFDTYISVNMLSLIFAHPFSS